MSPSSWSTDLHPGEREILRIHPDPGTRRDSGSRNFPFPDQPQVEQVVRDGRQYTTAVIRRVALVPTGPGERTIEPLGIEAQVRVRRRGSGSLRELLRFRPLLPLRDRRPHGGRFQPHPIDVEPLPPGRPGTFQRGCGRALSLTATVTPDSVDANEAVTLTLTASGEGNLRAIPEPTLDFPGTSRSTPRRYRRASSDRTRPSGNQELGIRPHSPSPGNRTIPSVSFGYFDTGSGDSYRTASTSPSNSWSPARSLRVLRHWSAVESQNCGKTSDSSTWAPLVKTNRPSSRGPASGTGFLLPMAVVLGSIRVPVPPGPAGGIRPLPVVAGPAGWPTQTGGGPAPGDGRLPGVLRRGRPGSEGVRRGQLNSQKPGCRWRRGVQEGLRKRWGFR